MIGEAQFIGYLQPGACEVCTGGPVARVVHEQRPPLAFSWRSPPAALTRPEPLRTRTLCLRCFRLWRAKVVEARSRKERVDLRTTSEREADDIAWHEFLTKMRDELDRGF